MEVILDFLSRIRLKYTRSSTLLKCAVLAALVLSTAALITLRAAILEEEAKYDIARAKAAALEQDNRDLREYIPELGTLQSIRRIAEEELGYADQDTVIFVPEQ